jgi:hypothetical protein
MNPNAEEIQALRDAGYTETEINEFFEDLNKVDLNNSNIEECHCINKCINLLPKKLPLICNINFIHDKKFIKFKYLDNKDLKIYSPRLFVRFGVDKYYNNWSVNFEIENNGCDGLKEFKQFLKDFEKRIIDKLEIDDKLLNTQLKFHDNYNMEFYGRIQSFNGKPKCEILDKRSNRTQDYLNLYNFPKQVYVKVELTTLGIWELNHMYCYKYTIDKLTVVD